MAELLIRLKNNTNPDPAKDRMCYKRGDIVVVMPDGHHWGRAEGLPDFAVVVVDRTVTQMEAYMAEHKVEKAETHEEFLADWIREKARGKRLDFTQRPIEGKRRTVGKGAKRMAMITLTGPVIRPHTRRRWRVNLSVLPAQYESDLLTKGSVNISFGILRQSLINKFTGVIA